MFKAWICIIIIATGAGSHVTTSSNIVADIARREDCHRVGRGAVEAAKRVDAGATYQCVEMYHTPE